MASSSIGGSGQGAARVETDPQAHRLAGLIGSLSIKSRVFLEETARTLALEEGIAMMMAPQYQTGQLRLVAR